MCRVLDEGDLMDIKMIIIVPDRDGGFGLPAAGAYDLRSFSMERLEKATAALVMASDMSLD